MINYKKLLLRTIVVFSIQLSLIWIANAAQLWLIVKYSDSWGGGWNLNQVWDMVNGRVVCPSANTNANNVPWCDMSKNVWYNDNWTPNDPSDDFYKWDLIVRTNDVFGLNVGRNWIQEQDGAESVTLTCKLPAAGGLNRPWYEWASLPWSCGIWSSISTDGKTLICVRTAFDSNGVWAYSEDLPLWVKVLGWNENGYKPGDIWCTSESPKAKSLSAWTNNTSMTITASPRRNMKDAIYTVQAWQTYNGKKWWFIYYKNYIWVDEVNGEIDSVWWFLGNESLWWDATITYTKDLSRISPNAELIDCSPDTAWINWWDPLNYFDPNYPSRSVSTPQWVQSMWCVSSWPWWTVDVTVKHLDATLNHYPTYDRRGNALPVNRKIAAINMVRVFVPIDDVKAWPDGILGTSDDGQLTTTDTITNFDPKGISWLSNFNSNTESTWDNSVQTTLYASAWSWDKYYLGSYPYDGWSRFQLPFDVGRYKSGKWVTTPGGKFYSFQAYNNYWWSDISWVKLCDIVDVNTYNIVADNGTYNDGSTMHTPGTPMYLYDNYGNAAMDYHYEYATTYESSRPPDPYTAHPALIASECDDKGTTWYTDFATAKAIGPITKVRVVMDKPVTPGQVLYRRIANEARWTDLNGNMLPWGTILPNYAGFMDSNQPAWWRQWNSYTPKDYKLSHAWFGWDRLILQYGKVRITKTATPLNSSDTPTWYPSSAPWLKIQYTLKWSFTTDGLQVDKQNITFKDLLPSGIKYVAWSTQWWYPDPTISNDCSLVQDLVSQWYICDSTTQILIRDLGVKTSNIDIPAIVFDTIVWVDVPDGTAMNYALIESPSDLSPATQRTANANTVISIPRSLLIVKWVELGSNLFNTDWLSDWIKYNINLRNWTQSPLTNLDVIDVFPFVWDGTLWIPFTVGANTITSIRKPGTQFTWVFEFTKASVQNVINCDPSNTKIYYTNRTPSQVNLSPTDPTNQWWSTTWCLGTETWPSPSCGFTRQQSTAIRITWPNMTSQWICKVQLQFATDKNQWWNKYSNNAWAFADGVSLPVLSNTVSELVYDYKIWDTVWYDNNQDGIYSPDEKPTSWAMVSLYNSTWLLLATSITTQTWYYLFAWLNPGTYTVKLSPVTGSIYGYDQDSQNKLSDGITQVTLSWLTVKNRYDIDFGVYQLSTVAWSIYLDNDVNAIMNSGDQWLSGFIVILSWVDMLGNNIYMTGLSSSTWTYMFTWLNGWSYTVSYLNTTKYLSEVSNTWTVSGQNIGNITNANTLSNITLKYWDNSIANNFGLAKPSSIWGNVWYDMDANTSIWSSEIPASWAKLIITYINSIEWTVTKTVYTDSSGNWMVWDIQTGSTYTVALDMSYWAANGYKVTTNNVSYSGIIWYSEQKHVTDQWLYLTNVKISKVADVTDATIWDVINYTITYTNNSSGTAYNVNVYDLFPFDFLKINTSSPSTTSPTSFGGFTTPTTLTYNIGTLAPWQSGIITISATVTTGVDAQIINNLGAVDTAGTGFVTWSTLTVTSWSITTNTTWTTETNTGDNISKASVTIYRIDLNIVKDVDKNIVWPNDIFEYTLHIWNTTGTVNNVVVMDTLDPNLIYVSMSTGTINIEPIVSGQTLVWTGISLAPYSTNTIKYWVKPKQYLATSTILTNSVILGRTNNIWAIIPLYETRSDNNASSAQVTLSGTNYSSLQWHVYFDQNWDKTKNNIDKYISWVVVNLMSGNQIISTITTDNFGEYMFTWLVAGQYSISYIYPDTYIPFLSQSGIWADSNGSGTEAWSSTTSITNINLVNGNNSINNDFSLVKLSSIWGSIYEDLASNMTKDAVDILLANQTVTLQGIDIFGNEINITTTTDGSGNYLFSGQNPWIYSISYTNNINNLTPLWSFAGTESGNTSSTTKITNIKLNSDVIATNYDFSLAGIPSTIAGNIYLDDNMTQKLDWGDAWLKWITVMLSWIDILGNIVQLTVNTDANGKYMFTGLADGVYSVSYTNNTQYVSEASNTWNVLGNSVGNIRDITWLNNIRMFYGQNSVDNNFALVSTVSVGGNIYLDADKNKTDNSEAGIAWQIVYLKWIDIFGNSVVLTTSSDANGKYLFDNVVPGKYNLSYSNTHEDLSPFGSNVWSNWWSVDSYQVLSSITLNPGDNGKNYNFWLIQTINKQTIAGNIYIDNNTSNLIDNWDNAYMSWAIIILSGIDGSGNVISLSTVAWPNWSYKFTNLDTGTYEIYLDKNSLWWYINSVSNPWTISWNVVWISDNLKIKSINLWFEQDSKDNNFWLVYMDLTTNISANVKNVKAGDTVTFTVTYSNEWIIDSQDTIIDLSSLQWLIIDPSDLTRNLWTLWAGKKGSFTFTAKVANDPTLMLNTLDAFAHIYSKTTPERDILTNKSKDSVYILPDDTYSLAGNLYDDQNDDKYKSIYDLVYNKWASITLSGKDRFGRNVNLTTTPGADGKYSFTWMISGSYNLEITNLNPWYKYNSSNAGMINNIMVWNWSTEAWSKTTIANIILTNNALDYNFGVSKIFEPAKPSGSVYIDTPVITPSIAAQINTPSINPVISDTSTKPPVVDNTSVVVETITQPHEIINKVSKITISDAPSEQLKELHSVSLPRTWVDI